MYSRTNEVIVTEADGSKKVFPSVKDAAEFYKMSSSSIRNRITGFVKDGLRTFEYGAIGNSRLVSRMNKHGKEMAYDNIPYETLGTRLCITPCPSNGELKVGSARCQGCSRFQGIDREKHIVFCEKRKNVMEE